MLIDPADMLRHLFEIPQSQINRDVDEGEQNFDHLVQDLSKGRDQNRENEDPEKTAQHYHRWMVAARVLRLREGLEEEFTLYNAAMAANRIAEEAVSVAHEQGRLAELGRRMHEIQKREGLRDDEFWPLGEGPGDYQALSNESEELYDKVYDTVFTEVLRRYHLGDLADLYENDRPRYDQTWERGRKKVFGESRFEEQLE